MNTENYLCVVKTKYGQRIILDSDPQPLAKELVSFMKEVMGNEGGYFVEGSVVVKGKRAMNMKRSSLAKYLPRLQVFGRLFGLGLVWHPAITAFFEIYRRHWISQDGQATGPDGIRGFDDLLCCIRQFALQSKLKKKIWDWENKYKKNKASLRNFEAKSFRRRARLLGIRLDLNYHAGLIAPEEVEKIVNQYRINISMDQCYYLDGEDITVPFVRTGRVNFGQVQKDRERLFANIKGKPSLFKYLVCYIWCIEYGETAGYHLHLLLLFDGAYVQKDEYLAQEIGNYWVKLTDGRGYFENCNRKQWKYGKHAALGMVSHTDTAKRKNLLQTMSYFCKGNQMVHVLPYRGCRMFGHGFVHKDRPVSGGRPRRNQVIAQAENQG